MVQLIFQLTFLACCHQLLAGAHASLYLELFVLNNHQTSKVWWLQKQKCSIYVKHGPQLKADDNKPKKLTEKLTAPLKMESVTIIFSMFRLVTVEIFSSGVRYALIIAKMRAVGENLGKKYNEFSLALAKINDLS